MAFPMRQALSRSTSLGIALGNVVLLVAIDRRCLCALKPALKSKNNRYISENNQNSSDGKHGTGCLVLNMCAFLQIQLYSQSCYSMLCHTDLPMPRRLACRLSPPGYRPPNLKIIKLIGKK